MKHQIFALLAFVSAVIFAVSLVLGLSHLACVHFSKKQCLGSSSQWWSMLIVSFLCMVFFSLFVDNVQLHITEFLGSLLQR